VIARLNKAVAPAVQDKAVASQFEANGDIPQSTSPEAFGGWIKTSIDKLAQLVKAGDIKVE
jgi:tripartite-type tricarboxylate transporter receptor subunit TctC